MPDHSRFTADGQGNFEISQPGFELLLSFFRQSDEAR